MPQGNKPCLTLSGPGGVQLSVWKNRNADGKEWYSCKPSRRYLDKRTNEWKTTESFGSRDLVALALLCNHAAAQMDIKSFGPGLNAPAANFEPVTTSTASENGSDEETPF